MWLTLSCLFFSILHHQFCFLASRARAASPRLANRMSDDVIKTPQKRPIVDFAYAQSTPTPLRRVAPCATKDPQLSSETEPSTCAGSTGPNGADALNETCASPSHDGVRSRLQHQLQAHSPGATSRLQQAPSPLSKRAATDSPTPSLRAKLESNLQRGRVAAAAATSKGAQAHGLESARKARRGRSVVEMPSIPCTTVYAIVTLQPVTHLRPCTIFSSL